MGKDGKQRIIDAASHVIDKQGVHNTTIQAILDEAEISKGGLYHHYKSKNAILYDIMVEAFNETTRMVQEVTEGATPEQIQQGFIDALERRLELVSQNKLQMYLLHEAVFGDDRELNAKLSQRYNDWIDRVETLLLYAYPAPKSPMHRAVATLIISSIDGLIMQSFLQKRNFPKKEIISMLRLFFGKGLSESLSYLRTDQS
ncbi:MAG: TetR/AcrR family transcriptional regulator [Candidatus Saccharibacteria bacterium]